MSELKVRDLRVEFDTADGSVEAVAGLSFTVPPASTVAIVGESGSGKSQTALAITGLLASNGRASGYVEFEGQSLLELSNRQLNRIRGARIGMIFQDPMTCLNPHLTIGQQMAEVLQVHQGASRGDALTSARQMLDAVNISAPRKRLVQYPHELSGGMRQRVMIAMALLCRPGLLIADEPTTALDVTVQAQILELLRSLQREFQLGILLITHDLGVVSALCEEALVMYAGRRMEAGATHDLLRMPTHPYTRGLLDSLPHLDTPVSQRLEPIPGQPPDLGRAPTGCVFANRCPFAVDACSRSEPSMQRAANRWRACHRSVQEITEATIA